MEILQEVFRESASQGTAFIVLAAVLARALVGRRDPQDRRRVKLLVLLVVAHVGFVVAAGSMRAMGSGSSAGARVPALTLGALAGVISAGAILFRGILPRVGVHAPRIVHDVAVAGAGIVGLLVVATRSGVDLSGVVATSAVLTAVIGLALQDTLGNVLGGLALQTDESIQVGDWIKVGDVVGRVVDIRWRYTAVETRNWETVVFPNSVLLKNQVTILGRRKGQPVQWRRWIWFEVGYQHPPNRVIATVLKALERCEAANVATDPPPSCVFMAFSESAARYAVRYHLTDLAVDDPTDGVVRQHIYFALQRAGVRLSIPSQAVTVSHETDHEAARVRAEAERRESAFDGVALFAKLPEAERRDLAASARWSPFAAGEVLTRQGAEAHWLYVIVSGECSVRVRVEEQETEVGRLGPGEFFGEMSLLTGAPRSATVVALKEVACWRLDREAFRQLVARRPEVAEEIAEVVAARQEELDDAREDLGQAARARRKAARQQDLVGAITSFFGLAPGSRKSEV
jgi:small-conductance mechanosensitive channel/CRP-like cAMP-binding protein